VYPRAIRCRASGEGLPRTVNRTRRRLGGCDGAIFSEVSASSVVCVWLGDGIEVVVDSIMNSSCDSSQ